MSQVAEGNILGDGEGESKSNSRVDVISSKELMQDFASERLKFILQQIDAVNGNVYRFLAIYQTLMVALVGGQISLFVGYRQWGMPASTARGGLVALLILETLVACFAVLMTIIGVFAWIDYRNEECDLTDRMIGVGFRARPNTRNLWRWYETYITIFVCASVGLLWLLICLWMMPNVR